MRSTMRQLNPHSLSYQLTTLARCGPSIRVNGASTIDECGSPLKSDDTSSSWLTARIPFSSPLAASSNAALMSSTVVDLPSSTLRSTTETSRTGTRNDMPTNLPVRSGSTSASSSASRRRSEEHTSELQSHLNLVCRLLLEKKK